MSRNYDTWKLTRLRAELWARGIIPKKWMLNYVRKAEAVHLLSNIESPEDLPANYVAVIKQRCSNHKKKVYRSKKNREKGFGTGLTREERLKRVINTAESLVFVEVKEFSDGFTSYLGSTRAKTAFVFKDTADSDYLFTRLEVEKLASLGLYVPRGVISSSRTKVQKPANSTKTLKDIFGN